MRLYRVILPVSDVDAAAVFYSQVLGGAAGERVTSGRHYFDCQGVLLALLDPLADGDPESSGPNQGHVYLSTDEPLETVRERVRAAGAAFDGQRGGIAVQPWGERSFYAQDPWGNPFCIVEQGTEFRGDSFHGR